MNLTRPGMHGGLKDLKPEQLLYWRNVSLTFWAQSCNRTRCSSDTSLSGMPPIPCNFAGQDPIWRRSPSDTTGRLCPASPGLRRYHMVLWKSSEKCKEKESGPRKQIKSNMNIDQSLWVLIPITHCSGNRPVVHPRHTNYYITAEWLARHWDGSASPSLFCKHCICYISALDQILILLLVLGKR